MFTISHFKHIIMIFVKFIITTILIISAILPSSLLSSPLSHSPLVSATTTSPAPTTNSNQVVTISTLEMNVSLQAAPKELYPDEGFSEDMLFVTFTSPLSNTYYLSVGVSDILMTGPLVGCEFPSSTTNFPNCVEMNGEQYDAHKKATQTFTVSYMKYDFQNQVGMISLRLPMSSFGVTPDQGIRRWIFARGDWKGGSKNYMGHHWDLWSEAGIDIYRGVASYHGDESGFSYGIFFSVLIVTLCIALVGAALKQFHMRRCRSVCLVLQVCTWLCICILFVTLVYFEYDERFSKRWAPGAVGRAVGSSLAYILSLMLLSGCQTLNIGYLAGSSYERFISFHVVGGWCVAGVIMLHVVLMAFAYGSASFELFLSWGEGVMPVLPASFGCIFFACHFLIAVFRATTAFVSSYYWFRVSHFFFPVFLIAFIIHWPPLGLCLLPSVLVYAADVALRFLNASREDPRITHIEVEEKSRVVKMVITLKGDPATTTAFMKQCSPGQYIFFSLSGISEVPHPFSFIDRDIENAQLTFYIRAVGAFTEELYLLAKKSPQSLLDKKGLIRQMTLPISIPEVDITFPTDLVFVGGGIGITATQGMLRQLVEKLETNASNAKTILFIWCVREPELASMMLPHIEECAVRLSSLSKQQKVQFVAKIFVTGKVEHENSVTNPPKSSREEIVIISQRRPKTEEFSPLASSADGRVSYFVCASESLLTFVRSIVMTMKDEPLIHEEVFCL